RIDSVGMHKSVIGSGFNVFQVFEIPGVGQRIEVDDVHVRVIKYKFPNHMRSDKSRSTCNENVFHGLVYSSTAMPLPANHAFNSLLIRMRSSPGSKASINSV